VKLTNGLCTVTVSLVGLIIVILRTEHTAQSVPLDATGTTFKTLNILLGELSLVSMCAISKPLNHDSTNLTHNS